MPETIMIFKIHPDVYNNLFVMAFCQRKAIKRGNVYELLDRKDCGDFSSWRLVPASKDYPLIGETLEEAKENWLRSANEKIKRITRYRDNNTTHIVDIANAQKKINRAQEVIELVKAIPGEGWTYI